MDIQHEIDELASIIEEKTDRYFELLAIKEEYEGN
jgi:hypothetical protein